jgi:hypothetical protein
MPVQKNIAAQHTPRVLWDGTTHRHMDMRKHTVYAFSFEVTQTLVADTVFNFQAAMPSDADPCVPGTWEAIPEVAVCSSDAEPGPQASVTLPAGTVAGTVCTGTLPCRVAYIRAQNGAGTEHANVLIAGVQSGPKTG